MKGSSRSRRSRGEIERLPSGSLRVRVYDGLDPASKKRRYLVETVPAGPEAAAEAERVRTRLVDEAAERRAFRARAGERRRSESPAEGPEGSVPVERARSQSTVAAVARLAGVSAPTVSKVLNGRAGVAAETRRRVERLLREQGYRRPEKVVAGGGRRGGLLRHARSPGGGDHARREAGRRRPRAGGRLHRCAARGVDRPQLGADLLARRPTGVIVAHMGFSPEQHGLLSASGDPARRARPHERAATSDPLGGCGQPARRCRRRSALLDLGHRRIAVITGPLERPAHVTGSKACGRRWRRPARRWTNAWCATGMWFSFEEGLATAGSCWVSPSLRRPCCAATTYRRSACTRRLARPGARIPEDLSVVGFDDISYSRWCGPPLTTVHQPFSEWARRPPRWSSTWPKANRQPRPASNWRPRWWSAPAPRRLRCEPAKRSLCLTKVSAACRPLLCIGAKVGGSNRVPSRIHSSRLRRSVVVSATSHEIWIARAASGACVRPARQ